MRIFKYVVELYSNLYNNLYNNLRNIIGRIFSSVIFETLVVLVGWGSIMGLILFFVSKPHFFIMTVVAIPFVLDIILVLLGPTRLQWSGVLSFIKIMQYMPHRWVIYQIWGFFLPLSGSNRNHYGLKNINKGYVAGSPSRYNLLIILIFVGLSHFELIKSFYNSKIFFNTPSFYIVGISLTIIMVFITIAYSANVVLPFKSLLLTNKPFSYLSGMYSTHMVKDNPKNKGKKDKDKSSENKSDEVSIFKSSLLVTPNIKQINSVNLPIMSEVFLNIGTVIRVVYDTLSAVLSQFLTLLYIAVFAYALYTLVKNNTEFGVETYLKAVSSVVGIIRKGIMSYIYPQMPWLTPEEWRELIKGLLSCHSQGAFESWVSKWSLHFIERARDKGHDYWAIRAFLGFILATVVSWVPYLREICISWIKWTIWSG